MKVAFTVFQVVCLLCTLLGFLIALQAIPEVAVMTSAIKNSARPLMEFSLLVLVILPLAATVLYNGAVADERMTVPSHLSSYMILLLLIGVPLMC